MVVERWPRGMRLPLSSRSRSLTPSLLLSSYRMPVPAQPELALARGEERFCDKGRGAAFDGVGRARRCPAAVFRGRRAGCGRGRGHARAAGSDRSSGHTHTGSGTPLGRRAAAGREEGRFFWRRRGTWPRRDRWRRGGAARSPASWPWRLGSRGRWPTAAGRGGTSGGRAHREKRKGSGRWPPGRSILALSRFVVWSYAHAHTLPARRRTPTMTPP